MHRTVAARVLAVATVVLVLHAAVILTLAKTDAPAVRPTPHPMRLAVLGSEVAAPSPPRQPPPLPREPAHEPAKARKQGGPAVQQRPQTPADPNRTDATHGKLVEHQELASEEKKGALADRPETAPPAPAAGGVQITRSAPPTLNAAMPASSTKSGEQKVELPLTAADYLQNPRPMYPSLSRRLNEQGQVVHSVTIGLDGTALSAQLVKSSGYERLDRAALETVMRWRYVPGKRGGTPTVMSVDVPINWVLE